MPELLLRSPPGEQFQVGVDHDLDELAEANFRFSISDEEIDFGRASRPRRRFSAIR